MNTLPSESVEFPDVVDRIDSISKNLHPAANSLVLIGGCARSGKSTLAEKLKCSLTSRGVDSILVPADCWLLPASQRKADTTVLKRYRLDELSDSVMFLLSGEAAYVTPYDARTRELNPRILTIKPKPSPFVVIVEGVITLAMKELRKTSALKLFVESGDHTRVKRLIRFYRDFKILRKSEYKAIIKEREIEEVPFIKATRAFADMVLTPGGNL